MASYYFSKPTIVQPVLEFEKIPSQTVTPELRKFFYYRAWNLVLSMWETWTAVDDPNPNPPSGNPVTGLTQSMYWRLVV